MVDRTQDRENLALVLALSRSYQEFLRGMGPIFRRAGLTPSQWDVLETLTNKGAMTINDLLAALLSTSGNTDVVIRNLIKAGLVEKTQDKADRRSRIVSLTNAGHIKVDEFYPIHNAALAELFESQTINQKRMLIKLLNILRKNIKLYKDSFNDIE